MMGNYHVRFGKGVNYMFDTKQFTLVHYNSIITAHAILMSAPMRYVFWQPFEKESMELIYHIKARLVDGAKPHGETQTAKQT